MSECTVGTSVRPPLGAAFALGWLMAELFDERRRDGAAAQAPSDAGARLPLAAELDPADRLDFLLGLLGDLLLPFPHLPGAAAKTELTDPGRRKDALRALHLRILGDLADEQEQLSAYQLGLALSDMCWLPCGSGGPDTFIAAFARGRIATVRTFLNGAVAAIPPDTAAIVGRSLGNWQDWIDVNAARLRLHPAGFWARDANPVLAALRVQAAAWHSVLTSDPDASVQPALDAWSHAAAGIARAARIVTFTVLRRFWPLVLVFAAALALLLYLVVDHLSGASQAWASLATIVAFVGGGSFTLKTAVARAFGGIGAEAWDAAKLDARAWEITWLPAMPQTVTQRTRLDSRGAVTPRLRRNLDT